VADLQDLLIRIDATTEQLRRELKSAEKGVEGTARKIDGQLSKVDKRFDAIGAAAKRAGLAIIASFGAREFGAKLIEVARQTDILDAQLKTATGSAEGATRAFAMLERIATETPFSLDQVVRAFVKLKNMGLDPSREALMSYGNTASAMGKSLDQMIEAVADAATAEFERLKEFGIRAKNQGDTVAFTFRGITTTVRNSAAEIEGYLRGLGESEFAGAMTERANSLDGALSNLADSWDNLFRTIARGPVGKWIESETRRGIEALNQLANRVAVLQGTSTPEQDLQVRMAELEALRESLVFNMSKAPQGSPYFEALAGQLEDVQARIAYVYDRLQLLKQAQGDLPGTETTGSAPAARSTSDVSKAMKKSGLEDPFSRNMRDEGDVLKGFDSAMDEARGFFQSTRTEVEQIEAQIARVKELSAGGFFRDAGIDDAQILERLEEQLADIEDKTTQLTEFGKAAAQNIQAAFADFLFDPFSDGLDGMLDGFLKTIQRMVAELAAQQMLAAMFGGFAGSSNSFLAGLGSSFGGPRASGGPVTPGKAYLVGEHGPELFSPSMGGRINPMGSVDVQVIDQRGAAAPPVDVSTQMVAGRQMVRVLVRDEVAGMFGDGSIDRMFAASSMPIRRTGRR
jgi:hypothetical protein